MKERNVIFDNIIALFSILCNINKSVEVQ